MGGFLIPGLKITASQLHFMADFLDVDFLDVDFLDVDFLETKFSITFANCCYRAAYYGGPQEHWSQKSFGVSRKKKEKTSKI